MALSLKNIVILDNTYTENNPLTLIIEASLFLFYVT